MRVVFMAASGLGHIHPVIPLARAAAAAGDEVLFAVPAEGVDRIAAFGFAATAVPFGEPADIGRALASLPDHDLNTYVMADIFVRIHGRAALPALRDLITSFRADLLVSAEMGALVAAEASGIDSGTLGITALDLADLDLGRVVDALDDLRDSAGLPRSGRLPYDAGSRFLGAIPPRLWADPAHQPADAIWFRHEDAEGPVEPSVPVIRPRPQVYATLGSVAGANDLGRPILRAVLDALSRLDADVLFTIGPFDREQLGPLPANVTVAAYAPQAEAMECDLVVTHAGSGTTVAALARDCRWSRSRCSPIRCTTPIDWSRPGSASASIRGGWAKNWRRPLAGAQRSKLPNEGSARRRGYRRPAVARRCAGLTARINISL